MYITTLIPKLLHFFYHEWQRVSKSSNHLIVTGWASILILILIIIIVILRCLWRRRGRLYEATKASLPSSNTTDTGVHLTQLITECVKASIHALQLRHDRLESHTTHGWRRCECGRSGRSQRSCCLCLWPLQSKLGLAPSDNSNIYGTHNRKVCRLWIGDRKMAKNSHDSWRKNELITGRRIPIDIYEG